MDRRRRWAGVAAAVAGVVVATAVVAAAARALAERSVELDRVQGSIEPLLQAGLAVAWWVPAAALVRRRPGLAFGWLGAVAATAHGAAAILVALDPAEGWYRWAALWAIVIEVPVLGAVVHLFPTGRPLEGWRWYLVAAMTSGALGVVAAAVEAWPTGTGSVHSAAGAVTVPLLAFSALSGIVTLAMRVRRTVPPERRAVVTLLAIVASGGVVPGLVALGGRAGEVAAQVFTAGELVFVAVAVLGHRVWGLAPMSPGSLQRVVHATDTERRRIRAELHDGLGAGLTAIRLKVDAAHRIVAARPERAAEMLTSVSTDLGSLIDDVRHLVDGLRPAVLDRMGLADALRVRARELSTAGSGLTVVVDDAGHAERLPPGADAAVYRVVSEALNNVVRHARASRCDVTFRAAGDAVVIEVVDDGSAHTAEPTDGGGLGLSSMAARAADVGGYVVAGPKRGTGFSVRVIIPARVA